MYGQKLGQILYKLCVCSRDQIFVLILMKLGQSVFLDEILYIFKMGHVRSKSRSLGQIIVDFMLVTKGLWFISLFFNAIPHNSWSSGDSRAIMALLFYFTDRVHNRQKLEVFTWKKQAPVIFIQSNKMFELLKLKAFAVNKLDMIWLMRFVRERRKILWGKRRKWCQPALFIFSSIEHNVLRMNYCDRSFSGVRPSIRVSVCLSVLTSPTLWG